MSKLGFHISAGNQRDLGDRLKKCADAGNPLPEPTPLPTPTSTSGPVPTPSPPVPTPTPAPAPSSRPLDFNVRIARVRKDPDRPGQIIVAFQIDATGGSGVYQYSCEGMALTGPTRDRPSGRSGAIVEANKVTSSDGQTVEKKIFFAARDFPPAT